MTRAAIATQVITSTVLTPTITTIEHSFCFLFLFSIGKETRQGGDPCQRQNITAAPPVNR